MTNKRRLPALAALAASTMLALSACASAPAPATGSPAPTDDPFPVTIEVPGASSPLRIEVRPERIVALSPDAAIAAHELGLTAHLVGVPESARNATLNPYADQMAGIPNALAGGTEPEPEQVLAMEPDLVVVTARHTGEQDASSRLTATGIPVLTFTNGWSSSDDVIENLTLLGAATGTLDRAEELADEIRTGVADVRRRSAKAQSVPSVAILSNQARSPFINDASTLVSELVVNGGGSNVTREIGVANTMPVQPEQLVAAHPDYIMLVDVTGKGRGSFDALLSNPAVAALPAVADGHVRMFPGKDVYGLAGREVVSASEDVLGWLHPDLAR